MSRKETAAQQPVGRRRSERRQRQAPRDSEASAGAGLAFQVRRGPGPTYPGPPPRGTSHLGWGGRGGPGPRAGRGGLRPGPPALSWIQSLRRFRRKTPVGSATGNFSLPHPPAITEFRFRVCTVVLALGSGETGAPPGWVRGSPRAETESPGPGPRDPPRARCLAGEAGDARLLWSSLRERRPESVTSTASPASLPSGPSSYRPFVSRNPRTQEARGRDLGPFSASGGFGHL